MKTYAVTAESPRGGSGATWIAAEYRLGRWWDRP